MRGYWDQRARENAMWFIHSDLDYRHPDAAAFWASGVRDLQHTLDRLGVSITADDRVLEIGSGIGRMTRALASRARSVVGVDVSDEMVERGRTALADVANAEVRLGNGRDLEDLADASFDVCYSFIVFQHIPDARVTCTYITEIGRVLRPGGWAAFQVSDRPEIHRAETWASHFTWRERLRIAVGRRPRGTQEPQWLGSALSAAQLTAALDAGGLELERSDGVGTQYHLVLARKVER
jgi:ubiquinone/menaquinone biosynthesis C-methylase UbiE